ncbi:thioesterase family protein [Nocardia sp. NPDC003482]
MAEPMIDELPGSFFVPVAGEDDTFDSTPATAGPWSAQAQHGGPPSALLTRALDRVAGEHGLRLARVTVELAGPVPVAPVRLCTRVVKAGSRTAILEGTLSSGGKDRMHLRAWAIRESPADSPRIDHEQPMPPLPGPQEFRGMSKAHVDGYVSAMEWRFPAAGSSFDSLGPDCVWARQRVPLLAGVPDAPLTRALVVADSNWAAAFELDRHELFVVNVDLTVTFARWPRGEWIGLRSRTRAEPSGTAYAVGTLYDTAGPCALVTQSLLVADR